MTDDTQDQRLTDADAQQVAALVIRDCTHEGRTGRDWCCADCHHLSNRVLAARSVRDDPTLRERIEAHLSEHEPVIGVTSFGGGIVGCSCLSARDYRAAGHQAGQAGYRAHIAAVLAEHAPADD